MATICPSVIIPIPDGKKYWSAHTFQAESATSLFCFLCTGILYQRVTQDMKVTHREHQNSISNNS